MNFRILQLAIAFALSVTAHTARAGGINPPVRPVRPPPCLAGTQSYTQSLFAGISAFYGSHAAVEAAVLAESSEMPTSWDAIESARDQMAEAASHFGAAAETAGVLSEAFCLDGFLKDQHGRLTELETAAFAVQSSLEDSALETSAARGTLQTSMWGDGRNQEVRLRSIDLARLISAAMEAHIQIVEARN